MQSVLNIRTIDLSRRTLCGLSQLQLKWDLVSKLLCT